MKLRFSMKCDKFLGELRILLYGVGWFGWLDVSQFVRSLVAWLVLPFSNYLVC